MKRRDLLTKMGAAAGGLTIAGAGVYATSTQPAGAAVNVALQEGSTTISGSSADGEVSEVDLDLGVTVTHGQFDAVDEIELIALVSGPPPEDGLMVNFAQTTLTPSDGDLSSPYEHEFSGNMLAGTAWEASDFHVDEDGATETTELDLRVEATVRGGGREATDASEGVLVVEVTNENDGQGGDPTASLSLTVSGNVVMA